MSEAFEQMALRVADDVTEEDGSLDLVAYAKTICAEMMNGNHPVSHLSEIWDGIIERRKHSPSAAARIADLEKQRDALLGDVERCYRMLLSDPDTKGALFKAENILREAIAQANEVAA